MTNSYNSALLFGALEFVCNPANVFVRNLPRIVRRKFAEMNKISFGFGIRLLLLLHQSVHIIFKLDQEMHIEQLSTLHKDG